MPLLWVILKRYTILQDLFLLDSVRYRYDIMVTLKFDWSNLKILMSGWYRKLTSSCVSFTIYQQCYTDIEGEVTPISLQYQSIINININIYFSKKKLEYNTVQLHVYKKEYIYAWWTIYTYKKAYLTWKISLNNN